MKSIIVHCVDTTYRAYVKTLLTLPTANNMDHMS